MVTRRSRPGGASRAAPGGADIGKAFKTCSTYSVDAMLDNVEVNGPVPVPEPSTYLAGLSALGMLGLFGWRNRK